MERSPNYTSGFYHAAWFSYLSSDYVSEIAKRIRRIELRAQELEVLAQLLLRRNGGYVNIARDEALQFDCNTRVVMMRHGDSVSATLVNKQHEEEQRPVDTEGDQAPRCFDEEGQGGRDVADGLRDENEGEAWRDGQAGQAGGDAQEAR